VSPKDQAVQIDDEQLQLVEAPGRQPLQFLAALFNKLAADAGNAELQNLTYKTSFFNFRLRIIQPLREAEKQKRTRIIG